MHLQTLNLLRTDCHFTGSSSVTAVMFLSPQEMQKCFDDKDIQMLQDAISKMDPTVSLTRVIEVLVLVLIFGNRSGPHRVGPLSASVTFV